MTQLTIHNIPISLQLNSNEQVTVPDGHVWRVTISSPESVRSDDGSSGIDKIGFLVNSEEVASSEGGIRNSSFGRGFNACSTMPLEGAVFVEGDTLGANGGEIHINGFVVSRS